MCLRMGITNGPYSKFSFGEINCWIYRYVRKSRFRVLLAHRCETKFPAIYPRYTSPIENFEYMCSYPLIYYMMGVRDIDECISCVLFQISWHLQTQIVKNRILSASLLGTKLDPY